MQEVYDIVIVGGGPAGIISALSAKIVNPKLSVLLLEKNGSLGKKLLITGNGRCNITTTNEQANIIKGFGKNGKFLYSSLSQFSNNDLIEFMQKIGLEMKEERGKRIFPKSDNSQSVLQVLVEQLIQTNVEIRYNSAAREITYNEEKSTFSVITSKSTITSKAIIIATGGLSYPNTGSTGDGYKFAQAFQHTVTRLLPSLVPLQVYAQDIRDLTGLTLKNVNLIFCTNNNIKICEGFGEMLFTHQGVTGPIVLEHSKEIVNYWEENPDAKIFLSIDLKPALDYKTVSERIRREILIDSKGELVSLLRKLLPSSLINYFISHLQLSPHKKASELNKIELDSIANMLKDMRFEINGYAGIDYAIVTSGGINLKEINPKTMESKLVNGLYFAGEILDLDGPTGGYNLQEAWTTGFVAGKSATEKILSRS